MSVGERWGLRGPRPRAREMISLDPHKRILLAVVMLLARPLKEPPRMQSIRGKSGKSQGESSFSPWGLFLDFLRARSLLTFVPPKQQAEVVGFF